MILNVAGILIVLVKLLNASVTEAVEVVEIATPSVAQSDFIFSILNRDLEAAKRLAQDNPFLTAQFNADIFSEILKCYAQEMNQAICEPFYELISPSFTELSKSETTPMIMAVFANSIEVFNKLIESSSNLIAKDTYGRTPLMYAARLDREYMMLRMVMYGLDKVENREELLNVRDKHNKSLLHHICESSQTDSEKAEWVRVLKVYGVQVDTNHPYAANVWAYELRRELVTQGAKVFHKDADKMLELGLDLSLKASLGTAILLRKEIFDFAIPFLFIIADSLPAQLAQAPFYYLGQLLLHGFDANLVLSYDTDNYICRLKFNLLFLVALGLIFRFSHKFTEMKQ